MSRPSAQPSGTAARLRSRLAHARFAAGTLLDGYPTGYYLAERLRTGGVRPGFVQRDTPLLIEGFPRSGNTFARQAFMQSNPGCEPATHKHRASHVLLALRFGVPALVLLRDPQAAVRSLLVRVPHVSVASALRAYGRFHALLVPVSDRLVFAKFETATRDFSQVVKQLNARCNTRFVSRVHEPEVRARIDEIIDEFNKSERGGRVDARSVARPHPLRTDMKYRIDLQSESTLLQSAQRVYR